MINKIIMSSIYQKCLVCNKKVFLTGKCRCENFYCGNHLHSHGCTFNYKGLVKEGQKVVSDKIQKI
jgi:hypothetical protein